MADGRIPFRIRIGVTGHRTLDEHDERLTAAVRDKVAVVANLIRATDATPVELAVITPLAKGGDRIVANAVTETFPDARVEIVLPLPDDDYAEVQHFTAHDRAVFDAYAAKASAKRVLRGPWTKDDTTVGYETVGRFVVRRCDVLIALWDGKAQRGRGGAAPTLLSAARLGKPCIWIPSEGDEPGLDNLADGTAESFLRFVRERVEGTLATVPARPMLDRRFPESTLRPLRESFARLDQFNRQRLDPRVFSRETSVPPWASASYFRASALARRFKNLFSALTWSIAALATGAAVFLGLHLSFFESGRSWTYAEIACLLLALAAFVVVKRGHLHQRWLGSRLLAERLRTAAYVAATGFDSLASPDLQAVFVDERAAEWSIRAFEEVWEGRPRRGAAGTRQRLSAQERVDLQHDLADRWIQTQIEYHEGRARAHRWAHRILGSSILVFFAGSIAFPLLYATHHARNVSILLSVALPIAVASVGGILTIRQDHALAERYERMQGDLLAAQAALLDAKTTRQLQEAASDAARIVASEAGDWFGTMWFLDVDHPA